MKRTLLGNQLFATIEPEAAHHDDSRGINCLDPIAVQAANRPMIQTCHISFHLECKLAVICIEAVILDQKLEGRMEVLRMNEAKAH